MGPEEWRRQQERLAEVEARLTAALENSRTRFEHAKREMDAATELMREIGANRSDGTFAMLKASREYNDSLAKYHTALKHFTDFVLKGRIPPDAASGAA